MKKQSSDTTFNLFFVTVASICKALKSVVAADSSDHKIKKSLYEKLGDGFCHFKNYSKALEYYQKMLEEAELAGEMGKALSPCYISLAQTYRDMKEYKMAIYYFYKDYELCSDNVKESVTTLMNIVETMEMQQLEETTLDKKYKELIAKCPDGSHIKTRVLRRYSDFLKSRGKKKEAALIDKDLDSELTDSETCESEEIVLNIVDDINISDITGISVNISSTIQTILLIFLRCL